MPAHAALARAYERARYRLHLPDGDCESRIGAVDHAADARLRAAGCRSHWLFITACNPYSRRLPAADNAARTAALRRHLAKQGWRFVEAVASDAHGAWPEPGFGVFDADDTALRRLAESFGQNAIVRATLGAAPQLVWMAP
ncbi:MAG: DUF3293 domain-containing protein [Solimonas sp.]